MGFEGGFAPLSGMALLVGAAVLFSSFYRSWARLAPVPGPLLASISNVPRLLWVWSGSVQDVHIDLHKKYGKIVRLGPNAISISDPHEIQKIYGTGANMQKVRTPHSTQDNNSALQSAGKETNPCLER